MAFVYDIRNAKTESSLKKKTDDFFKMLELQAKLNEQYNEAMENYQQGVALDIKSLPPEKESPEKLLQNEVKLRQMADTNLKTLMPAMEVSQLLDMLNPVQIQFINQYYPQFETELKKYNKDLLTATFVFNIIQKIQKTLNSEIIKISDISQNDLRRVIKNAFSDFEDEKDDIRQARERADLLFDEAQERRKAETERFGKRAQKIRFLLTLKAIQELPIEQVKRVLYGIEDIDRQGLSQKEIDFLDMLEGLGRKSVAEDTLIKIQRAARAFLLKKENQRLLERIEAYEEGEFPPVPGSPLLPRSRSASSSSEGSTQEQRQALLQQVLLGSPQEWEQGSTTSMVAPSMRTGTVAETIEMGRTSSEGPLPTTLEGLEEDLIRTNERLERITKIINSTISAMKTKKGIEANERTIEENIPKQIELFQRKTEIEAILESIKGRAEPIEIRNARYNDFRQQLLNATSIPEMGQIILDNPDFVKISQASFAEMPTGNPRKKSKIDERNWRYVNRILIALYQKPVPDESINQQDRIEETRNFLTGPALFFTAERFFPTIEEVPVKVGRTQRQRQEDEEMQGLEEGEITEGRGLRKIASGIGSKHKNKHLSYRRKIIGRGIEPSFSDTYKQFGKFIIHIPSLKKGIINLKFPSKSSIPKIPQTYISQECMEFIFDLLENQSFNRKEFQKLNEKEKKLLLKIFNMADLDERFELHPTINQTERDQLKRFEILKGEILAGQNAPQVLNEMAQFLDLFMKEGRISKNEGMGLIQEIQRITA